MHAVRELSDIVCSDGEFTFIGSARVSSDTNDVTSTKRSLQVFKVTLVELCGTKDLYLSIVL